MILSNFPTNLKIILRANTFNIISKAIPILFSLVMKENTIILLIAIYKIINDPTSIFILSIKTVFNLFSILVWIKNV
jgi:hypothetical protein